jgi:hypothetical protein
MTGIDILHELDQLGVDAYVGEDGKLRLVIPPGVTLSPSLRQAIRENKAELVALLRKLEIETIKRQLLDQGWVLIRSGVLNENVVWCRDETVSIPAHLSELPRYSISELKALVKEPIPTEDDLKLLHAAKKAFRGTFLDFLEAKS